VTDVVVRPVALDDRDALLAWRNDPTAFRWYRTAAPVSDADHDAWLAERLARPDPLLWLAELDGRPVGSVRLDRIPAERAAVSVAVDRGARGRGVGSALLAHAAAAGRALGCAALDAEVGDGNEASLALFASAGYVAVTPADDAGFVLLRLELVGI
jgi:RimJ/RimL family protein N-acetyltransferase